MTTILDQPETTSALPGSVPTAEIGVATGLLVSPDFGTSTGVVAPRRLRSVGFVVTGGAVIEAMRPEDPAAEVRALRDRIGSHGLSRQEIARAIGVDRRSLSGFAKGDIRPSRERLEMLRILADLVDAVAMERPGRVMEVLLARRGRLALIDQVTTSGRSIMGTWRAWVTRIEATVTVTPRAVRAEPTWAAAGRALMEGRLSRPPRAHAVRAESTYETDLDQAAAFAEPEHRSGRRGYQ